MCVRFEIALRRHCPTCCIPYADTRLDCFLPRPSDTALFSPRHFGNANGTVTTGVGANWTVEPEDCDLFDNGLLTRQITDKPCDHSIMPDHTPYTNASVETIRRYQSYEEMSQPYDFSDFELYHGGPHKWIGGYMANLTCTVLDPIFFSHHGMVDKLGDEVQARIAPENWTFPHSVAIAEGCSGGAKMLPFEWLINAQAFNDTTIGKNYSYEPSPFDVACSTDTDCSPTGLLWCDNSQCKATSREDGICDEGVDAMCYCDSGTPQCDEGICQCLTD